MKVLDLQCAHQHVFEGWFGSEDEFQEQLRRGLVVCPFCGDAQVSKRLSAPRLNLGAAEHRTSTSGVAHAPADEKPQDAGGQPAAPMNPQHALELLWLKAVEHVVRNTEDVGTRFAEEARKIHYGEAPERGIRGQASPEEASALADEGIEVAVLPLPDVLKGEVQ